MSVRDNHVPLDRLTALAFVARAPETEHDPHILAHLAHCQRCAAELSRLTRNADGLRDAAYARADAVFDDAALDAQRTRILDRLAHLGQVARVLRFPARARTVAMPVSVNSHRWVTVAAAAGLIIGLVVGQMIHLQPAWDAAGRDGLAIQAPARQNAPAGPAILPASALPSISDDEFLAEIAVASAGRSSASVFRTLDALTPVADIRDPIGR